MIQIGEVYAGTRVLRGSGRDWLVRCQCGHRHVISAEALKEKRAGRSGQHCYWCRWRRGGSHRKITRVPCLGCQRPLLRLTTQAGTARCQPCQKKKNKARTNNLRKKVLGRECIGGCGRNDSQTNWSARAKYCAACDRNGARYGWCECAACLWKANKKNNAPLVCRAGCRRGPRG